MGDFASYEALKTSKAPMMVGWFTGHFSTAAKMYGEQFHAMASANPKAAFYTCDIDDVPRAAYDAEVTEVPSVVIQPIGLKPDGSAYDKSDMIVVAPEESRYDQVISRAKAAIDATPVVENPAGPTAWEFFPPTGLARA